MIEGLKRKMAKVIALDVVETILCSADGRVVAKFQEFHVFLLHCLKLFRNRVHDYKDRFGKQILSEVEFLFEFYCRHDKVETFARMDFYGVFQKLICGEQQTISLIVPKSKQAEFYTELGSLKFGWQNIIDIFICEEGGDVDFVIIELTFVPCYEKGSFSFGLLY